MTTKIDLLIAERTRTRDRLIFCYRALESCDRLRVKYRALKKSAIDAERWSAETRLESITIQVAQFKAEIAKIKASVPNTDFFKVNAQSEYKSVASGAEFARI